MELCGTFCGRYQCVENLVQHYFASYTLPNDCSISSRLWPFISGMIFQAKKNCGINITARTRNVTCLLQSCRRMGKSRFRIASAVKSTSQLIAVARLRMRAGETSDTKTYLIGPIENAKQATSVAAGRQHKTPVRGGEPLRLGMIGWCHHLRRSVAPTGRRWLRMRRRSTKNASPPGTKLRLSLFLPAMLPLAIPCPVQLDRCCAAENWRLWKIWQSLMLIADRSDAESNAIVQRPDCADGTARCQGGEPSA